LNYPTDFFDLVREGKIKVIIGEVESFEAGREVLLSSGQRLDADAVICATGWEAGPSIKFLPAGIEKELGLPSVDRKMDPEESKLVRTVERRLYARFPFLEEKDRSKVYHPDPSQRTSTRRSEADKTEQPYRLYRFMVPPSDFPDRSIGFAGALMTLGTAPCAYIQALWLTAYLDGTLQLPSATSIPQIRYQTYMETLYCAIRHAMGYGNKYPDLVFDSLPYYDVLLKDLGTEGKRKSGLITEYFGSYGPEDYRGLVSDWESRVTQKKRKAE
jgi:hypothetical protein